MAELALELANLGCEVIYVAEQSMTPERAAQGWIAPDLPGVVLKFGRDAEAMIKLAKSAPVDSIHICQGIRGNGSIAFAQVVLKKHGLRQWVVMETIDDVGFSGLIKRLEYRRLFIFWRRHLRGVLAIGKTTRKWLIERGVPTDRVFPFAYFLKIFDLNICQNLETHHTFKFIFVGQLIERKRLDWLLLALNKIKTLEFELIIVGSGPLESKLKGMAEQLLPGRVRWAGRLSLGQVPKEMRKADCLVLPSRHDGWGAVISEAMMVGTPVVCSSACGAAGVVQASCKGGVFINGDRNDLVEKLENVLAAGVVQSSERFSLAAWASCLSARVGAQYLFDILNYDAGVGKAPIPPWHTRS